MEETPKRRTSAAPKPAEPQPKVVERVVEKVVEKPVPVYVTNPADLPLEEQMKRMNP